MKLNLTPRAKFSLVLLSAVIATQLAIGIKVVHNSVPLELGSMHQVGAMTVLSALVFCLHSCKRLDPRHVKNILGKIKMENPVVYRQLMKNAKSRTPESVVNELNKFRR
mmetsp:Transcript_24692/g.21926  ORF Transcript_24692/g.21926 Transcript_24692/m.21926 type:complete len:109 (+) Transcript_24692:998-1324(+)